jgi:hypothetical protein
MNIEITPQEYLALLDILHIADVIMSGHRQKEDKRTVLHHSFIQKIYSRARSEGHERLINYNEATKGYEPAEEFEHNTLAHVLVEEFEDHLFWDGLINRLTIRDAALIAGGIERLNAMNNSERRIVEGPIRQRYLHEFRTNGVSNLEVLERQNYSDDLPVKTSD